MYVKHSFELKEKVEKEHQKVISMVGAKIPLGSLVKHNNILPFLGYDPIVLCFWF